LWDELRAEDRFEDRGSMELLCIASEALDRVERLRAQIDRDGEVLRDARGTPKSNPLVRDEMQGRALISRLLDKLGVLREPRPPGRPPKW
jgi:hypothetical protein